MFLFHDLLEFSRVLAALSGTCSKQLCFSLVQKRVSRLTLFWRSFRLPRKCHEKRRHNEHDVQLQFAFNRREHVPRDKVKKLKPVHFWTAGVTEVANRKRNIFVQSIKHASMLIMSKDLPEPTTKSAKNSYST